jgi:hypothetical protein
MAHTPLPKEHEHGKGAMSAMPALSARPTLARMACNLASHIARPGDLLASPRGSYRARARTAAPSEPILKCNLIRLDGGDPTQEIGF